ncbi:DNA polymerase III subunit chi [Hyphococcus flavus]|uniref:DNA polymerase III subunit chi n=1 Tax=Hyphococcus flavus TaxID=1866326 RepID=A0AAE9ZJG1_9PROT|nr:DNA polymerase III subunit chi [Hyphococcus flavus]WDI31665.1 DNA polymerase III subunit chi [Hyphococcus flavus]
MTEVLFYHLERGALEDVLPGLLEKTLERGWKAVVRAGSRARVEKLDNFLWTYREESFLPHASAGEGAGQPVWLTDNNDVPNNADVLFLTDGAKADMSSLSSFVRCVLIFDGRDDDALEDARTFWKEVKTDNHEATYWKQSPAGKWEKQA